MHHGSIVFHLVVWELNEQDVLSSHACRVRPHEMILQVLLKLKYVGIKEELRSIIITLCHAKWRTFT